MKAMGNSIQTGGFENDDARTLVFSFAGQGDGQLVGFEWVNFFKDKPVKVVNVRDCKRAYYMGNLHGDGFGGEKITRGVDAHVELFREIIKKSKCERVVMVGVSLGGYAAALYGVLLNVDYILPYSSQTFIREHPKYGKNDRPHLAEWARRAASTEDKERYFDLTDLNYDNFTGEIHFHWCTSWKDERYVKHMTEFAKTYPGNKHGGDADMGDVIDVKIHDVTWKHSKLCQRLKGNGTLQKHFDEVIL
jgi:hypothetical protein